MIVIVGGTGALGAHLVKLLAADTTEPIRIVSRNPSRASTMLVAGRIEAIAADVREPAAMRTALEGARVVVSAMHGFGVSGGSPASVDDAGNRHLIDAARAAGAEHVVLVSVHGAAADHPLDLFRSKFAAEQALRASGLSFTIVRPTAFMETWAMLLGEPLRARGKTVVFGPGRNEINFVSAHDVARIVARAVTDASLRGQTVEVAGPENLSFDQLVDTFSAVTGATGPRKHLSIRMMRMAAGVMRVFKPAIARHIRAAIVLNTTTMTVDPATTPFADLTRTKLAEVVRRDYA